MTILRFKTSIKCNGCISNVTPYLNQVEGIRSWKVELSVPQSTLEVEAEEQIEQEVIDAVKKAGYTIVKE
jgi:copper chaperone